MPKPNIVWICSDHHRSDMLGCYGHPVCRTPSLDRLASQGVQFDRCFTQNPVCSPARAALMTGCLSRRNGLLRNGMRLRRTLPTIADALAAQGYHTAAVGKLHLTPTQEGVPAAPYYGFQDVDCCEDNSLGNYLEWALENFPDYEGYLLGCLFNLPTHDDYWQGRRDLRQEFLAAREQYVVPLEISARCNWGFGHYSPLPEAAHKNTWITDRAIDAVSAHDGESPLLLWVGYVDPHNPFDPPRRFREMYAPSDVPPRIWREGEQQQWPPHLRANHQYYSAFDEDDWRTLRALFCGSVTFMDEQIGRLIAALEGSLDMGNTIVVYTSDHGDILGDHGICGKAAYHYDGGVHVPLLCRWDGHWQARHRVTEIVEHLDVMPSLLAAADVTAPVTDGRPLTAALQGGELTNPRGHAYIESFAGGPEDPTPSPVTWARTIRSDRWRATFYPDADYGELFDLESDPQEVHNLWFDPQYREVIEQHRKILLDRMILMDFPITELHYAV